MTVTAQTYIIRSTKAPCDIDTLLSRVVDALASIKDLPGQGYLTPVQLENSSDRHGPVVIAQISARSDWLTAAADILQMSNLDCRLAGLNRRSW
jgi:hypothetical protein